MGAVCMAFFVSSTVVLAESTIVTGSLDIEGELRVERMGVKFTQPIIIEGSGRYAEAIDDVVYCALSKVEIVGEDKDADDVGSCIVTQSVSGKWMLEAISEGNTNRVVCSAVCISGLVQ